ncbi:hypothetical protein A1O3_03256 [Capronia epimyces CBS 606.96]|uniref:Transcription factor domain-containing protein n=1 Tax=Capronia epimyces CBS 606.96 TaxID=1182542 RepID=W9Y9H6_9EURO|nr:uncharacterized protein A1O3_03256 [Capronia epimyces CBS 606.96]EXJ86305.1 hypothetical protein A1O3_03256 [Capronia epimyces CBS 606.96]
MSSLRCPQCRYQAGSLQHQIGQDFRGPHPRLALAAAATTAPNAADLTTLMNSPFVASYAFNPLHPVRIAELGASSLGFPDDFPILNDSGIQTHEALHTYMTRDISHNVGINHSSQTAIDPTTSQWLLVASADRLTLSATLAFWSLIEQGWNPSPKMKNYCLKVQSHLISLLQDYINSQSGLSTLQSILFAASTHLMCVNIFGKDDYDQRRRLMDGLEQLVRENGGFEFLRQTLPDSVIQNLLWTDLQVAYLNLSAPRFRSMELPAIPASMRIYDVGTIDAAYWRCCSPDVLSSVKPFRLLILYRQGSALRPASHSEFQYLIALFRYIDVQLGIVLARHHDTISSSECISICMALLRIRGVTRWKDHDRIAQGLLACLENALRPGLEPWIRSDSLPCLAWICVVALFSGVAEQSRQFFLQLLRQCLERQMGPLGPEITHALPTYLGRYIMPLVWPCEIDARLATLGVQLANLSPHLGGGKAFITTPTGGEGKSSSSPTAKSSSSTGSQAGKTYKFVVAQYPGGSDSKAPRP